jgi:hypothetical protein
MPISWVESTVPFIAAALAIYFMWRDRIAQEQLLKRTVRGTARIRRVDDWIYSAATGQTLARLALEVRPPSGIPYALWSVEWYILPTANVAITEGLILDVRIEQQDPSIIYPAVDWARRR